MAATKTGKGSRVVDDHVEKRRINAMIDADWYTRLMVLCAVEDKAPGEVLSDLLRKHLKDVGGYEMPRKMRGCSNSGHSDDRQDFAGSVVDSAQNAAA